MALPSPTGLDHCEHHDAEATAHRDPAGREEQGDGRAGEPGGAPGPHGAGETGRDSGEGHFFLMGSILHKLKMFF